MVAEKLIAALFQVVKSNGLLGVAILVIVLHGITKKFLRWMYNEGPEELRKPVKEGSDNDHPLSNSNREDMVPYKPPRYSTEDMIERSKAFYENMNGRRSTRFFSPENVPMEVIENIIKTAGTSPSGAHTEPWTYVVVKSSEMKAKIREIIEHEEEVNYKQRMGEKWVKDLEKFKTNWIKPYLTEAPYLVVLFKQTYGTDEKTGERITHYYHEISVSISAGLFIAAVQNAGLVTLTSTPLNAGTQLRYLLGRGKNEKVVLLLPVGYPAIDCVVPNFHRKPVEEIMTVV